MKHLTEEPDWETQDCVHLYMEDSNLHLERFTGPNNEIYVAVDHPVNPGKVEWYQFTPAHWNICVDRAGEVYAGSSLYVEDNN